MKTFSRFNIKLQSDVPGFTNDEILGFLYDCVRFKKPKNCVEIGSFMGRSTSVIAQALEDIGGVHKLYCIDFFVQIYNEEYLKRDFMRYMINRCGPEVCEIYTDFKKLKTLEDCFNLTLQRKPLMKKYVTLIKSDSLELDFQTVPEVDFAYIDGGHKYEEVRSDVINVCTRLTTGGVIVFDDYLETFPGVIQLVDEFAKVDGVDFLDRASGDVAYAVNNPNKVVDCLSNQ